MDRDRESAARRPVSRTTAAGISKIGLCLALCLFVLSRADISLAAMDLLKGQILEDRSARWQITAQKMSYLQNEGLYLAEGDVVITRSGQTLKSQNAKYNEKTGIVEVSGDVVLELNGDLVKGESAILDLNTRTGQITKGSLFLKENHYYIHGDFIERQGPDTYLVKGCRVTTCDGDTPDWSISGSEVSVTIEGYGTVKNAVFRIRGYPAFYIPYAIFPAKTKRQSGLLPPRLGYSHRNGLDTEIPFFWAISQETDATFYERYMTKRGLMQGIEYRYVAEGESKGTFLFDILSDKKEKDLSLAEDIGLSPVERSNKTRYWLRSRSDQTLPFGLTARLDTDYVSDQDYLKEFHGGLHGYQARPELAEESGRPLEEVHSPTRRSALRLSRDGEDYSLQALSSYHQWPQNPVTDSTPQPLGGLNYSLAPGPISRTPFFFRWDSGYDYVWRDWGTKGHRLSFTPDLSYPTWLGPYLEFEPSISLTHNSQWFDKGLEGEDRQSRDIYDFQTRLGTVLERTFDFHSWDVERLKHKVLPSLTYQYGGHREDKAFRPWFEPMDLYKRTNVLTLSVENLLDARRQSDKGLITYSQWATLRLSQGYDIAEAHRKDEPWREKKPLLPLEAGMTLTPFRNLNLDAEAHWDHDERDIAFVDMALEFGMDRAGGLRDTYGVEHRYVKGNRRSVNYYGQVNLLAGFSVGTSQSKDLSHGNSVAGRYWLDYQSQCWGVRLIAEKMDEVSTYWVTFRLFGLGDFGRR